MQDLSHQPLGALFLEYSSYCKTRLPVRGIKVVEGLGVEVVAAVDAML